MTQDLKPRIAIVLGTRPEALKLGPVLRALAARGGAALTVISTGQHKELLRQALEGSGTAVHHDLAVLREADSLGALAGRCLGALDALYAEVRPDFALVQGDTTTAFVGALAAFYRGVPVGHVEAGLRTETIAEPFPEEAHRRLVTPLAALHFAPTPRARENLLREGVPEHAIHLTGNPVVDALEHELARQEEPAQQERIAQRLRLEVPGAAAGRASVLVTCHRRESRGAGIAAIGAALAQAARAFPHVDFVVPLHPNPQVGAPLRAALAGVGNLHVLGALDRELFVALLRICRFVLTDSGGVQEEAPCLGKPVLVLRERTERPEGIEVGAARLVGSDPARIVAAVSELVRDEALYRSMAVVRRPYGDGHAGSRIAECVLAALAARAPQP